MIQARVFSLQYRSRDEHGPGPEQTDLPWHFVFWGHFVHIPFHLGKTRGNVQCGHRVLDMNHR